MSSLEKHSLSSVSLPLKVLETIEGLCKATSSDLDKKILIVVVNLINLGVDPESIADLIIELKSKAFASNR